LHVDDFNLKLLSLFLHVAEFVFKRTGVLVFFAALVFGTEVGKLSVELINLELLLGDINLVFLFKLLLLFDFLLFSGTFLL